MCGASEKHKRLFPAYTKNGTEEKAKSMHGGPETEFACGVAGKVSALQSPITMPGAPLMDC